MKRASILFLLLLAIFSNSQAQNNSKAIDSIIPQGGDMAFSIFVDGLIDDISLSTSNTIAFKYYRTAEIAYRLGFGIDFNGYKRLRADSVGVNLVERDSLYRQHNLNIRFGLERHLGTFRRLDPFVAADLSFGFIGQAKIETENRTISNAGTALVKRTIKQDGGFTFGLIGSAGFNYFIANRFSLGTEIGIAFTYSQIGGTITDNTVNTPVSGSGTSDFNTRQDEIRTTDFDVIGQGVINLSYFF